MNQTWEESRFLVIFLWMYYVTKRVHCPCECTSICENVFRFCFLEMIFVELRETSQFHAASEWFGPGWTDFVANSPCCPTTNVGFV